MVHEQEYTVKIKVTGNSTMQMEMFEDLLNTVINTPTGHKHVTISAVSKNGIELKRENTEYTFDRFFNGVNRGSAKSP